jgi:SAM-dependent methyltransferase
MIEADARVAASSWVLRWLSACPGKGRLLDLACGSGRHVRLALQLEFSVVAVDRDPILLDALPKAAHGVLADLESPEAPEQFFAANAAAFDVVLVTNYLYRPHFEHALDCVAPEGLLVYETFAAGNAAFGKPSNPAFLLEPRELLHRLGADWHVLAYEDGVRQGRARIQRIAAIKHRGEPDPALLGAYTLGQA